AGPGRAARVATSVAIEFAASCSPLVTANASAAAIATTSPASMPQIVAVPDRPGGACGWGQPRRARSAKMRAPDARTRSGRGGRVEGGGVVGEGPVILAVDDDA